MYTKEKLNIVRANIENLTSLWQTASAPFHSCFKGPAFTYCQVKDADWPNRLWLTPGIDRREVLYQAVESLRANPVGLTLPYWDIYGSRSYEAIEEKGLTKKFEQAGMSLKLDRPFARENRLSFKLVSGKAEARLWAGVYPRAFGYRISPEILMRTRDAIQFYLAYFQGQPAGTAIVFNTRLASRISGIHGVGVVPEMRKLGIASEIMKFVLNRSIEAQAEYATLQASEMGKGLYLKLGFEEQFRIRNYTLPE